jgi:hypothetical protein
VVRIEPVRVVVEPGGQVPVTVTVRNTSEIVEGFRLTVHGAPAAWADVVTARDADRDEGDVVRVYPGAEVSATVLFTAPAAGSGEAGEVPFCVLATSVVDPTCSAAAEGDLEVGRVDGLTASITPVTSTGRWSGRHTVKISNWGNAPVALRLTASDPDDALGYLVHPDRLDLPVGASAVAAVRVRSRRPFLRGSPVRLPFRVVAEPDSPVPAPPSPAGAPVVSSPSRPVLDGALSQQPVVSKGAVALAALAVVGLAAGVTVAMKAEEVPARVTVDPDVPAPTGVRVTAVGADSVRVNWDPVQQERDGFLVFLVDPATRDQHTPLRTREEKAPGTVAEKMVGGLTPDTEVCVQVAAVRGESQSPPSTEDACARTDPPPVVAATDGTPSPTEDPGTGSPGSASPSGPGTSGPPDGTGTGTGTGPGTGTGTGPTDTTGPTGSATATAAAELPSFGDRWVLYWPFPRDRNQGPLMEKRQADLEERGATVGELDSTAYPELRFPEPRDLLYVGPFDTREDAMAHCTTLGLTGCGAIQPGDPG